MRFPSSILVSVSLFTAETTAALYLSSTYRSDGDQIWQGLTLLFTLAPSVLVQLTLTFIHRDLSRDRPLVLLLHILQLGPIVRSVAERLTVRHEQIRDSSSSCSLQLHHLFCLLYLEKKRPKCGVPSLRTCCCFHPLWPFCLLVYKLLSVFQIGS